MALTTTPKSATADSYVSVTNANTYLTTNRTYTTEWDDAVEATRERVLRWATNLLDLHVDWYGYPTTQLQALRFPRVGLVDRDGRNIDQDTIPTLLERATSELALALLQRNRTAEPATLGRGIERIKVDVIDIKIKESARIELIPADVLAMVSVFGRLADSSRAGGGIVKLERV